MRQLKGGRTKETRKEKRGRKEEFAKSRQQFLTYCLPVLAIFLVLLLLYIYVNTRPKMAA